MVHTPAIWFHAKNNGKRKSKESDKDDKDKYAKFFVSLNNKGPANDETTEWSVQQFEDGTAEEYIKWRVRFDDLSKGMNLNTVDKKYTVVQTLLRGEARAGFNAEHRAEGEDEATTTAAQKTALAEKKLKAGYIVMARHLFLPTESS